MSASPCNVVTCPGFLGNGIAYLNGLFATHENCYQTGILCLCSCEYLYICLEGRRYLFIYFGQIMMISLIALSLSLSLSLSLLKFISLFLLPVWIFVSLMHVIGYT